MAVRVDNAQQKNCRWYSGSRIYRHVRLMVTEPIHVAHWGVAVTTPEVNSENATVQVTTLVKNDTPQAQDIVLATQLINPFGQAVSYLKTPVKLWGNSEESIVQTATVTCPMR